MTSAQLVPAAAAVALSSGSHGSDVQPDAQEWQRMRIHFFILLLIARCLLASVVLPRHVTTSMEAILLVDPRSCFRAQVAHD